MKGTYLNPGNGLFKESLNSQIYVDKSNIISYTNRVIGTKQKYICVSRPRRFGKSMAIEAITAYYEKDCDSYELFKDLKIAQDPSFKKHLNKYDVIRIDIQWVYNISNDTDNVLDNLQKNIINELYSEYPEYVNLNETSLANVLTEIYRQTERKFIIIIDEWDCLFRKEKDNVDLQKKYIKFLESIFKGAQADEFIMLAYMTGILPIKKYGTQSALNNFSEFTMSNPKALAEYVGFTEDEVQQLCKEYNMNFAETKRWYDGYTFRKAPHIYNPKSVVSAMLDEEFDNYWTRTETYESLKYYISMDFDGLKDAITTMLSGSRIRINTSRFQNDMTTFNSKDDILTLLIHLGYLAYDIDTQEVFIPNKEIIMEFENAISDGGWDYVVNAIKDSEKLLEDTINLDSDAVSNAVDKIHSETTSIWKYNDENSLSCVITLAYFAARDYYTIIRELPTGKGFADIVLIPLKNNNRPAMIIELKYNKNAKTAIDQIKEKNYPEVLENYKDNLLIVGINYNKDTKKHECVIEKY